MRMHLVNKLMIISYTQKKPSITVSFTFQKKTEAKKEDGRSSLVHIFPCPIRLVQFSKQKQPLARLSCVCTLDPCLYHALFIRRSAGVHVNTFVNISTDFPYRCRRACGWLACALIQHDTFTMNISPVH